MKADFSIDLNTRVSREAFREGLRHTREHGCGLPGVIVFLYKSLG